MAKCTKKSGSFLVLIYPQTEKPPDKLTSLMKERKNNNVPSSKMPAGGGSVDLEGETPSMSVDDSHNYAMLSLHPPSQLRMVDFRDSDLSQVINWTLTQVSRKSSLRGRHIPPDQKC